MELIKLSIADQDDLKKILEVSGMIADECEVDVYYRPERLLYDTTLVIVLTDQNQEVTIEVGSYYQSMLNHNLGSKLIGRDFSKGFISELDDLIADKAAK